MSEQHRNENRNNDRNATVTRTRARACVPVPYKPRTGFWVSSFSVFPFHHSRARTFREGVLSA